MGLLRLATLGSPEVFHDGSRLTFPLRKAEALLLYLAVEGGLHPRGKLATLLWPDSDPEAARKGIRNALLLLRSLLADSDSSPSQQRHLLSEHELLGLNPQTAIELDLDVVQRVYNQAVQFSAPPSEPQRTSLIAQIQHALTLVRGPFLDGFWLREETGFDAWHRQQQYQWQARVFQLFDRLSSWQEAAGESEPARATLMRWLALDPLAEEAHQRLMRVYLAQGNPTAALQIYAALEGGLARELQTTPSADTIALADYVRATAASSRQDRRVAPSPAPSVGQLPRELTAPLIGRATAFTQVAARFQQASQGQPQLVLIEGEAGIGKTRLANDFKAWARAHDADVLNGQVFEMGGRLPYQPLVEAIRQRLEEENAPEDLLDDPWLAELSLLLPELRVRYPDLLAPTQDELTAKIRLFEAVARLVDALTQRAPLVFLLDDLHWADVACFDLLRYLGRHWIKQGSRVLLLGTMRCEEIESNQQLSSDLSMLSRDLPTTRIALRALSQTETIQLLQATAGNAPPEFLGGDEQREYSAAVPAIMPAMPGAALSPSTETPLVTLGDFLFAHTGGHPFYLLETLTLFRDRQWLVPRVSTDGAWRLEPTGEMVAVLAQKETRRALVPPSVRALILERLARLHPPTHRVVQASAVLGNQATATLLWQLAELDEQTGIDSLEQAVGRGLLREERIGVNRQLCYRFTHDLIREVVYTELGEARRHALHQRALVLLQADRSSAAELAYHALEAGEAELGARYSMRAGDEALAIFAVDDAIRHYQQARSVLQECQPMQALLEVSEVVHLYTSLGQSYTFLSEWEHAEDAYDELIAYAQRQHLPALVSMTLNRLAILALPHSHDKAKVRAILEEAWHMAEVSHDQKALAETECNLAQIFGVVWEDPKRAFAHGQRALSLAREVHSEELEARSLFLLGWIQIRAGNFEEAAHCLEASLPLYVALGNEQTDVRELSIAHYLMGAPLTQPLAFRTSEALCRAHLAVAQLQSGLVYDSIRIASRALALSREIKNVWVQVISTNNLTHGLLEAGAYEEAFNLTQQTVALARALPPAVNFQVFLTALGSTYQALQQWDEARTALEEAEAVAEKLDLGPLRVPALSRLCLSYGEAGEWEAAYRYALKAITARQKSDGALIVWDYDSHYETEALLHKGNKRQARIEVERLGESIGNYRRFRVPYLRSLAILAHWDGESEQAIGYLREAAALAADLGLPREQWQIQVRLGKVYAAAGEHASAQTAFDEAATIIQGLAEAIGDEVMRASFLAGPQIQPVLQQARQVGSRERQ